VVDLKVLSTEVWTPRTRIRLVNFANKYAINFMSKKFNIFEINRIISKYLAKDAASKLTKTLNFYQAS